jgi:Ca2+-binding RTX toxin-like protein
MPQFPANIDLSNLKGFKLSGANAYDASGRSVASAGDVNGDGFADVIVGAPYASGSGASYVVFGQAFGFASNIDLSSLDGSNGFKLSGEAAGDRSGFSVASAGDVNGDGFADLIVGARDAGAYVVFGKAGGFASNVSLSSLDGDTGFKLSGVAADDVFSVASAGDVNGDGFEDLIVGTPGANPNGAFSGASYVVFGKAGGFAADIDLSSLDGSTGFKLSGAAANDLSGSSVASAGDVNGDGFADLIVGAYGAEPNGNWSGASYVVFGKASGFKPNINLSTLGGTTGFKLSGATDGDESGCSVASAGDVNSDGFDDLIIGASRADPNGHFSGASYVVFGKAAGFASNVELSSLDGSTGFRLSGVAIGDQSGISVATAGDVNGDGFADLIVGAYGADPHGSNSGASYVVFGKAGGFAANINLSSLDGSNGFRLSGVVAGDYTGFSVASAGDVNGDGFADLIVGARGADPNGDFSGASYVVFGRAPDSAVVRVGTAISQTLAGGAFHDVLVGLDGDDQLHGNGGGDTLDGGNGNDVLRGGTGDDSMNGGAGDDIYYADSSDDAAVEFANQGTDTVHTTASFTLGQHVENVTADSDAGLILTGNSLANTIIGGGGNDTLSGGGGNDKLKGGGGNDTLNGGAGADAMNGGAGDDRYYIDNAGDTVADSSGLDSIYTTLDYSLGAGFERLYARVDTGLVLTGNNADNTIVGRGGNDALNGDDGNDTLNGGAGADAMDGGDGDDRYFIDNAGDTVTDSSGFDSVYTTLDHALGAGFERLLANTDTGLALTGNGADNTIIGGGGGDTIAGGAGRDVMTGGAGGDTFVFQALSDSVVGGRDLIRDFVAGVDKIDLDAIDANTGAADDQAFSFIGAGAFTHTAGELQAKAYGVNTLVSGDVDGNGTADFQILLAGQVTLQETDFLL